MLGDAIASQNKNIYLDIKYKCTHETHVVQPRIRTCTNTNIEKDMFKYLPQCMYEISSPRILCQELMALSFPPFLSLQSAQMLSYSRFSFPSFLKIIFSLFTSLVEADLLIYLLLTQKSHSVEISFDFKFQPTNDLSLISLPLPVGGSDL